MVHIDKLLNDVVHIILLVVNKNKVWDSRVWPVAGAGAET